MYDDEDDELAVTETPLTLRQKAGCIAGGLLLAGAITWMLLTLLLKAVQR